MCCGGGSGVYQWLEPVTHHHHDTHHTTISGLANMYMYNIGNSNKAAFSGQPPKKKSRFCSHSNKKQQKSTKKIPGRYFYMMVLLQHQSVQHSIILTGTTKYGDLHKAYNLIWVRVIGERGETYQYI